MVIVITGSTRGIGFGLADAFLARHCNIVINGRTEEAVSRALDQLSRRHGNDKLLGVVGDVAVYNQVQSLWDKSVDRFGEVDIWINNAGVTGPREEILQQLPNDIEQVLETNLQGTIFGSQIALSGMLNQGHGAIYNMEGAGSDGRRMIPGMAIYGTSKRGVRYFNEALIEETHGKPIIIGIISPGMVLTDLLTDQEFEHPEDWEKTKRVYNILADRVETVAPWLADKILANKESGMTIRWLTRGKVIWRFLKAPFSKRDIFTSS
jgi:NADP-dependent 3-hydroxy acid dehydrogenase YdfG